MRDLLSWNVSLGRWAGIHVRLHVFFVLFGLFALFFAQQADMFWFGLTAIGILLVSVVAHEAGHCLAASRVGGTADQIVVSPFGGLSHVNVSHDPRSELITSMAGPMVNAAVCVLLAVPLLLKHADPLPLLNPLQPPVPATDELDVFVVLQLTFWINWLLTIINFLPAFPFDGGRALRAVLWPRFGFRTAVLYVVRAAKITALGMFLLACGLYERYPFAFLPLSVAALFVYFIARQEAERLQDHDGSEGFTGYDFSQGYTSLDQQLTASKPPQPGFFRSWLESRRAARLARRVQIEADEERRVDEILARLHEGGSQQLSDEDRALLDRVSARFRNRLRN